MLPRELIKERLGRSRSTGLHVLIPLADTLNSILVVQTVRLQVVSQDIVEPVSRALAAPSGELLQLH